MKERIRWIGCICLVFISFLFLFSGCGGGGIELTSDEDIHSAVILGRIIVPDVAEELKALLKEGILSHLTGNITEHADVQNKLDQIEDGLPPELISFSFSPSTIYAGKTVTISAILNEETQLTSGYLYLREYSNQERSIIIDEFIDKGESSGTWKIEADLKILGYERPGEYFIYRFEVSDEFGNRIVYSSHPDSIPSVFEDRIMPPTAPIYPVIITDESENDLVYPPRRLTPSYTAYLRWDYAEYEILPTLSVKNANPDVEPPTFESLFIEPVILSSSEDEVTINIVADDDWSGVKDIYIKLELIDDNMLSLKRNDPYADPDFWDSLPTLTIEDSAIEHEPEEEEEEEGPEFISVEFTPNPANAGDEVAVKVQLSNPNSIDYIDVEIENSSGYNHMGFYLYGDDIHFNEKNGLWIGEKKVSLSSYVESGNWEVYSLRSGNMDVAA